MPGIVVQSLITASVSTGTGLREDMDSGVFDRFRSLPIARISPLAGALLVDTLRYGIAATTTFLAGFALGYRPDGGLLAVLGAALLVMGCAWALSWCFAFLGIISRTPEALQGIAIFVLYPLTLLSGRSCPSTPCLVATGRRTPQPAHLPRQRSTRAAEHRPYRHRLHHVGRCGDHDRRGVAPLSVRAYQRDV